MRSLTYHPLLQCEFHEFTHLIGNDCPQSWNPPASWLSVVKRSRRKMRMVPASYLRCSYLWSGRDSGFASGTPCSSRCGSVPCGWHGPSPTSHGECPENRGRQSYNECLKLMLVIKCVVGCESGSASSTPCSSCCGSAP